MSAEHSFTLTLEQTRGYQFEVHFDWDGVPDLVLDEPAPLGHETGPNAARLLGAAVGNCLSASLLFCLAKQEAPPGAVRAEVQGRLGRNAQGRLRVQGLSVELRLGGPLGESPKLARCLDLFEDFCVLSASVRQGVPIEVRVRDAAGTLLKPSEDSGESP